ncbi:MAG: OmpH family outer membrane protein [Bacteroidales bacterium]|nr:OmpH family outer membrane protein [Bacteroidales bacterium]MBN2762137.1 OmpH family outer membrane protein [Bacteroidales bacterium]
MKKLPLILSIASIVAVTVLYILFFTSGEKAGSPESDLKLTDKSAVAGEIVFIDIDTVLDNYDMYIDYQDEFERKAKISEAQLSSKQKIYQKDLNDYQYKTQRGLVTRSEAQQIEQKLYGQQQDLLKLQQDLQIELAEQEQVTVNIVLKSIMDYLKEIQPEYNYTYVFANRLNGGSIFYGSEKLDITRDVIKGLNEKYNRVSKESSGKE